MSDKVEGLIDVIDFNRLAAGSKIIFVVCTRGIVRDGISMSLKEVFNKDESRANEDVARFTGRYAVVKVREVIDSVGLSVVCSAIILVGGVEFGFHP